MTKAVVRNMKEAPGIVVERSRGATLQVLIGPEQQAPRFVTRCFTLTPGARIPTHRHATIEHEQVMLEGEMALGLDDEEKTVGAGDAMYIPPGVAHWYENRTTSDVRFLCIVPRTDDYETEWLENPAE